MSGYSHYRYAGTINGVDIKYSTDNLRPAEFNVEYTIDEDFYKKIFQINGRSIYG